ncbi:DUF2244 domain-containing protein [soil metagenome]
MIAPMPSPAFQDAALYMDAVIRPNHSLSKRGLYWVMGVTIALSLLPITIFTLMGAPFAPLFVGLDVLGLWFALHVATKAGGERSERVQVSSEAVRVIRRTGVRERRVWSSPTAFTRIDVSGEGHETRVRLRLSARSFTVAASLSPDERRGFADALADAVRRARLERYPG